MRVAIIGSGNAGCAHAFKLSEKGHQVSLIKTSDTLHQDNYDEILKNGGIWGIDNSNNGRKSFQKIHLITRDIKEGLENADVVLVMTQSLQHKEIAEKTAPYIDSKTRMILVIPGNLGSLYFYRRLKNKDIILAEGESTPFDARIVSPGVVNILFKNVRNALAFLPVSKKQEGIKMAEGLVDTYKYTRNNIVESALHNPNLIVHAIGVIMSASRIEMMNGEFWMYREAFSPSIWNLIEEVDNEKNRVIEIFKGEKISYLDACKFRNEIDLDKDAYQVFNDYAATGGPKGPASLQTRYLYEDVQNGLCLLNMLGEICDVPTPITNALITIASSLVKYDFSAKARKPSDFGIENFLKEDLINFINT